ncbi:MAG: N-acetylglucosamine-6-phosphate deacetylase [Ancalomicrobiaceae bacterium]|nr:N-acetylglucosamine-6-phosphate deacetylase [Ancalomicrobiaceae bacterium]
MARTGELTGRILTPDGFANGRIHWRNGIIEGVEKVAGVEGAYVLPGFVDLHCHGGGCADVMEGGEASRIVARTHAASGTTSFLATTMTAPVPDIEMALAAVERVRLAPGRGEAAVLGVHLEGPFISPERLGAQPANAIAADVDLMRRFLGLAAIKVVTIAAEVDPDGTFIRFLDGEGIRVQLGHSLADYDAAARAFRCGCRSVTHLFNAMSPLQHRAPGIVGAAFAHLDYAELIPDLLHVHPGAIRAALRAIPNVYAVTDATLATGMPDGAHTFGARTVFKCDNGVRLADGTLAGSSLTMLQAFRNFVTLGLSIEESSRRTSTIAADYIGALDRGRLASGAVADMVVIDENLSLIDTFVGGRPVRG